MVQFLGRCHQGTFWFFDRGVRCCVLACSLGRSRLELQWLWAGRCCELVWCQDLLLLHWGLLCVHLLLGLCSCCLWKPQSVRQQVVGAVGAKEAGEELVDKLQLQQSLVGHCMLAPVPLHWQVTELLYLFLYPGHIF